MQIQSLTYSSVEILRVCICLPHPLNVSVALCSNVSLFVFVLCFHLAPVFFPLVK